MTCRKNDDTEMAAEKMTADGSASICKQSFFTVITVNDDERV